MTTWLHSYFAIPRHYSDSIDWYYIFLLAMLMYWPKLLYTYSRYIFGSFVSTHLQMNLKRKLKAKLLFKSSCFKRYMVYANNKVLVFPLLYDSLIHVRKKGFFLCAMWPFSTQVWQGFSCDWYMIAKKDMCTQAYKAQR